MSMSVQELEARIERLSADIERQKEVLKKLENSKSALQRQLNNVRDPVGRLPLEISSEIFLQCRRLPPRPQPGARHIPMLLLNVCNAWSDIAIATPALWTAIHIEFPRPKGFSEFLGMWLKRARNHPLFISLYGTFDDGIATVIWQHTEDLKGLEIFVHDADGLTLPRNIFPSLQTFTFGSLPHVDGDHSAFTDSEILDFLRLTPNLLECTFNNLIIDVHGVPPGLVLPSLRHLRFGKVEDEREYCDTRIIKYLSLPSLQTLYLSIHTGDITDFDLFLRRSSPPLRKLVIAVSLYNSGFVSCLCLVPSITHFELYSSPDSSIDTALFAALSDTSSFLPNLRCMKICHIHERLPDDSYEALFGVLSLRRAQLVSFELRWAPHSANRVSEPDAHLLAAFRQLVAEGMEIHIGTEDLNFI
ncbi:hypothetical protein DFH09DRAFT_1416783 [Mycena vulgaris]|nr:hypothetical protein DFH09DRAFT_1416783 [Mycena vulgaris]